MAIRPDSDRIHIHYHSLSCDRDQRTTRGDTIEAADWQGNDQFKLPFNFNWGDRVYQELC
jgi:hypothetical protein